MPKNCPICEAVLEDEPMSASAESGFAYECPRCGKFILSYHTEADLQRTYIDAEAHGEKEEKHGTQTACHQRCKTITIVYRRQNNKNGNRCIHQQ